MIFRTVIAFVFALAGKAHAFPQTIAHGYSSCLTCHYQPTGGGMLTPYGRSLSKEILSQWGEENEEQAFYGVFRGPEFLQWGGDIRVAQTYNNSATVEAAKFFMMQADIEAGIATESLQVVGTLGIQNDMSANATGSRFLSRRHYLQYSLTENQTVRLGKMPLPYGIQWPDHFLLARRELGWDEGSESYQLAWHGIHDEWETDVSLSAGRPEEPRLGTNSGINLRGSYAFAQGYQLGGNIFLGSNDVLKRALVGAFGSFTLQKQLTLFLQLDLQKFFDYQNNALGIVETLRLNYEILKGLHLMVIQEMSRGDLNGSLPGKQAYTLGFQWFPRPHLELAGGFRRQRLNPLNSEFTDLGWLIFHYYL